MSSYIVQLPFAWVRNISIVLNVEDPLLNLFHYKRLIESYSGWHGSQTIMLNFVFHTFFYITASVSLSTDAKDMSLVYT